MKKTLKKTIILMIALSVIAVSAGCGKKADPIDLPPHDEINTLHLILTDGTNIEITAPEEIHDIVLPLENAEPTSRESVNDEPQVKPYGTIILNSESGKIVLYYYEKDGEYYLERPYAGIYLLQEDPEAGLNR